jgi:MFS family permease
MKYDPRTTGLLLGVLPLAVGLVAPVAGSLSDRYGTRRLTVIGLGMLLCGYYAVSTLSLTTTYLGYALRFLPIGIGLGFFQSPNNSAIMGTAPRERLGVASGLLSITRTLGQITGIAVLGALWASLASISSQALSTGVATNAPPAVQVAALNRTSQVIVGVILVAFLLSLWALFQERKAVAVVNSPTS